jgi:sterol desaturase/sphingolipid hydroxylase (fatty acid hydroxylase superfamily)
MAIFVAFITLMFLTASSDRRLTSLLKKRLEEWVLDGAGLFVQGVLIPLLQITVIAQIYRFLLPTAHSILNLHPVVAFCCSFVLVDYLYYWNHRLLHSRWFWPLHQVHHTMTEMDVLGTSRNTVWSSFFILYLWIHALLLYLLQNPAAYGLGITLTAVLDLWRHSKMGPPFGSSLDRWLSPWLILPQDHAWHHAIAANNCNYGANLKLWDKLHGTSYQSDRQPVSLGIQTNLTLTQKLFWPFP